MSLDQKIKDILLSVDKLGAAALFDIGTNITISARAGMALIDKRMGRAPDVSLGIEHSMLLALESGLNAVDKDHCFEAILGDCKRAEDALKILSLYSAVARKSLEDEPAAPPKPADTTPQSFSQESQGGY